MSSYADRPYKVIYTSTSRPTKRETTTTSQRSDTDRGYTTKTTYNVGSDAQVRKADVVVVDQPRRNRSHTTQSTRPRVEYEVVKPERRSGVYVIETEVENPRSRRRSTYSNQPSSHSRRQSSNTSDRPNYPSRRSSNSTVLTTVSSRSRPSDEPRRSNTTIYSSPIDKGPPQSDLRRSKTLDLTTALAAIKVIEESSDDEHHTSKARGRSSTTTTKPSNNTRLRSALRNQSRSPETLSRRRRSQSVGFRRDQIADHDASQRRHERPGAEAHNAGIYLQHDKDEPKSPRRLTKSRRSTYNSSPPLAPRDDTRSQISTEDTNRHSRRHTRRSSPRDVRSQTSLESDNVSISERSGRKTTRRYSPQRGGGGGSLVDDNDEYDEDGFRKRSWSRRRK